MHHHLPPMHETLLHTAFFWHVLAISPNVKHLLHDNRLLHLFGLKTNLSTEFNVGVTRLEPFRRRLSFCCRCRYNMMMQLTLEWLGSSSLRIFKKFLPYILIPRANFFISSSFKKLVIFAIWSSFLFIVWIARFTLKPHWLNWNNTMKYSLSCEGHFLARKFVNTTCLPEKKRRFS